MITYDNKNYYTVNEVNTFIKSLFDNTLPLNNIFLIGEVSNFRGANRSGHLYFSLKDEKSNLSCVMFKYDASYLDFSFKDGDLLLISGTISSYVPTGTYQLVVKKIIPYGEGNILLKREQLKNKLASEGLFDESKKLPLPYFPKVITIICGKNSAAERDFNFNLTRRNPLVKLKFIYATVQGNEAYKDIINSLNVASIDNSDLIILGRGGGAKEDLSIFDNEELVRKVASLNKPIITAIGHEINLSLVDLASSKHVSTPTQACEEAVIDINELIKEISYLRSDIYKSMNNLINNYLNIIYKLKNKPVLTNYINVLNEYSLNITTLKTNINNSINKKINYYNEIINSLKIRLSLKDIKKIIKKGYALIFNEEKVITNINDLKKDDLIKIELSGGTVEAIIKNIRKEN